MRKQLLALACVVALAGMIYSAGCSARLGSQRVPLGSPSGSLVVSGGDVPLCNILSFTVTITGMALTPQLSGTSAGGGGGGAVSVLPAGNSVTLDFASLMDFTSMLSLSSVPSGTYTQLAVTLANPSLTYLDTSVSPPVVSTLIPTLSTLTVTIDLNPPLTVAGNGTGAIALDFNLLQSVLTDPTTGELTGNVTPTFSATPSTSPGTNGFAEFEDLRGIAQSVTTTSSNSAFTGSFTLQPATGQTLTVEVTSATKLEGISSLGGLVAGTFVEVHAFADANANIVAKEIVVEEQEDATARQAAFLGLITSVTRTSGSATQFDLYVREEDPDLSSLVPLGSVLPVTITSATRFVITAPGTNFANFTFDPTTLGAGQRLVVHGELNSGTAAATASARSIFMGLQSILGNLDVSPSTPVVVGSDGMTGGFTLMPCSPLFQSQPITVLTSANTTFAGITSLAGLTSAKPFLVTKGLLFYEQSLGTVNSVTWLPPANLQVATQVHQLP